SLDDAARKAVECVENELDLPVDMEEGTVELSSHRAKAFAIPLGIDYAEIAALTQEREVIKGAARIRKRVRTEHLVLGVERLDYTKGIPERLLAFEHLLSRYPSYRGQVTLIQKISPSRSKVGEYRQLKQEIDQLVGHINGRFQRLDWIPVHYLYQSLPFRQLVSLYLTADIGLVTPLVDGLNLVAKEYVAAKGQSKDGVLILSETAGAARELTEALLVNPYDVQGVAQAMRSALTMSASERRNHMERLTAKVKGHNIYWWLKELLGEVVGPCGEAPNG
ncbi:MAG: trehalose-6-phosphate synthase, partial [Anaerolineae bacterium]